MLNSLPAMRIVLATTLGVVVAMWNTGCGGSDGDRVGFATGQSPDPVVLDIPILYVKRPLPVDDNGLLIEDDAREAIKFAAGADIFLRERASPSADDRNITAPITEGMGDVRDLTASYDGTRVAFALRLPLLENVQDEDQPKWNIWEYSLEDDTLRRVIESDIVAEAGHDINPAYLADDRIVFSSSRQRTTKAILLDEGKPQYDALTTSRNEPVFLLHVMENDGSDIDQISYNVNHDLEPSLLDDGRIVFRRYDVESNDRAINLYTINPDGTNLKLLYGALSHATGTNGADIQFLKPTPLPDGRILTLARGFVAPTLGGDLLAIDTDGFVEIEQPVLMNAGMPGPAQESATLNEVSTDDSFSLGGRYADAFPLFDGTGRIFISWSDCRVSVADIIRPCTPTFLDDPAVVDALPLYGLWIYEPTDGTQLPVVSPEEGIMFSDVVAVQARPFPPTVTSNLRGLDIDPDALDEQVGILHIRSVYDIVGQDTAPAGGLAAISDPARTTIDDRTFAFIRLFKAALEVGQDVVEVPNEAFGRARRLGMREIIGYAPVAPDGSVMTKVPANVAFQVEVVDIDGVRRAITHRNWMHVRPGELLECNGCHRPNTNLSHGRDDLFPALNAGAQTTGLPFPNTNPAYFADFGETMAQVRARISCANDCAALTPSLDLVYEDEWTDPVAAGRPIDEPVAMYYGDLQTPAPATLACIDNWTARCRAIINYETSIHSLWGLPRVTLADDGVTVLSDYTCSGCHTNVDAAGAPQVPAGQLDLSDGASPDNAGNFKAYRELYFGDNEQEIVDGQLIDRLIEVGIDPETLEPIFQSVPVAESLAAASAANSGRFFDRFGDAGTHAGFLTPAELRLLREWVDIGGQYYNNQFDVPQD